MTDRSFSTGAKVDEAQSGRVFRRPLSHGQRTGLETRLWQARLEEADSSSLKLVEIWSPKPPVICEIPITPELATHPFTFSIGDLVPQSTVFVSI